MKKAPLIILVILILAVAGYSAFWHTQAGIAKAQVEQLLEQANAQQNFISYESVETSGFPFAVGVSIEKPSVDIPVNQLVGPLAHALPISPDGTELASLRKKLLSLPEWQETLTLDGRIIITINALSNTYHINTQGEYRGSSMIGDESWTYEMTAGEQRRACEIDFSQSIASDSFADMWNWELLSENPSMILENITRVECDFPETRYVGGPANAPLFESKPARIFFQNYSTDEMVDIAFDVNFPGLNMTSAYDELAEKYFRLIYDQPMPMHYKYSYYGDQSIRMKGKVKLNEEEPQKHPIHIELEEFSVQSDVSNIDYTLKFSFDPTGQMSGMGEFYNKATFSANEQGYQLSLSQAEDVARDIYQTGIYTSEADDGSPNMSKEQLTETVKSLVPKTYELGEMLLEMDIKGSAEQGGEASIAIDNIEVGAAPYGLQANGSVNFASVMIPIPTGNLDITCRACEDFVSDVSKWLAKFKPLIKASDESEEYAALISLDEAEVAQRVINFLERIDSSGGSDLNFIIELTPQGALTINGISTNQLMGFFGEELGPLLIEPEAQ